MIRSFKPVFLLSLLLPAASCQKVINVKVNDAGPQIVITGEVTNAAGPYRVTISKSVGISDDNSFPPVGGAKVIITGSDGLRDSLVETTPGSYTGSGAWMGKPGISYTLSITAEGKNYSATSTMPQPVTLDSVGFAHDRRLKGKDIIKAVPYYQDPADSGNYYQFTETINGIDYTDRVLVSSDRLYNGKYVSRGLDSDTTLKKGYTLTLSMYCIDKSVYDYLSTLNDVSDAGKFSSVTPANPSSNISNGALGYFSAHTIQSKQVIVY